MKKYLYNLILLLRNINNYGIITFFKIIFFEIYNILKFWDFSSIIYDDKKVNTYEFTKQSKTYNTPYIPTPYYFLGIVSNFFKHKKINNFIFLDLGCGYSRTQNYFSRYFKQFFLGVDLNKKIILFLKERKIKNSLFFNLNIRKKKNIDFLIKKIVKLRGNRKLIVFFSDSFDLFLLNRVLKSFSNKLNFYCILINVKNQNFLSTRYKRLFFKKFNNRQRNIKIIKIYGKK